MITKSMRDASSVKIRPGHVRGLIPLPPMSLGVKKKQNKTLSLLAYIIWLWGSDIPSRLLQVGCATRSFGVHAYILVTAKRCNREDKNRFHFSDNNYKTT